MSVTSRALVIEKKRKDLVASQRPEFRGRVLHSLPAVESSVQDDASRANESAREKLLFEHLPHVRYVARRIHDRLPPQVAFEDLVQAGVIGLIDAVRKFDPTKNVRLKHYAEFRIRGAILDSLREVDWGPRALRRKARKMHQAIAECKSRLGRDPNEFEVAGELNISLEALQRLQNDLRSLDMASLQSEGDLSNIENAHPSETTGEATDPYEMAMRAEMNELLERAISELPDRERRVLRLYHYEELTMREVGAMLNVGESRVSQIHTSALFRLRARMRELSGVPARRSTSV